MGGGGDAPPPPDYYKLTSGELQAKADLAPSVYATEAKYRPQYGALNLQNMQDFLQGTPGGTKQVPVTTMKHMFRNQQTGALADTIPKGAGISGMGYGRGGGDQFGTPSQWLPYDQQQTTFDTVNTPGSRGYLSLAGDVSQSADQMAAASATRQRAGDINDMSTLGPGAVNALMAQDPYTAMLMAGLTDQANQGMIAGTNLTPAQMRLVTQSVRQGQADRGMGYGSADQYGEALGVSQFGQNMLQQRMQNAQNVAGQRQQMYGAPATAMMTRTPQNYAQPYLQQGYGISSAAGPKLFGTDMNASDIASAGFNAQNAQYISNQNNSAAMTSAGISAGAGLGAAALMAFV